MMPATVDARVRLPEDSEGFVRRACPACAREFKTRALPSEDALVQATFMAVLEHANASELPEPPRRSCPYCGHQAPAVVFLTAQQRQYIEGWARQVAGTVRYERFRYPELHLSQNPYVTYFAVPPKDPQPALPREPDDMAVLPLLCCGEETKILPEWRDELFCHYCRARHRLPAR